MITKKDIERCCQWFAEEDIPYYYEELDNEQYKFYTTIGDYDYEISQDEISYRSKLIEEGSDE